MYSLTEKITQADLRAALAPLVSHGIPSDNWTVDSLFESYITPRSFLKWTKIVTSVSDDSFRAVMIKSMVAGGFFDEAANATPKSLIKGCEWLKTDAGKRIVRIEQMRSKLAKRAMGTTHSVEQVALLGIFDHQRTDLAVEKKKLKMKLSNVSEIKALLTTFLPAGEYVEMTQMELKANCNALSTQERRMREVNGIDDVELYGKLAKEEHVLNFLAAEAKRGIQLKAYLESKILFFHSAFEIKKRDKFMDLLSVCFGGDIELPGYSKRLSVTEPDENSRPAQRPRT